MNTTNVTIVDETNLIKQMQGVEVDQVPEMKPLVKVCSCVLQHLFAFLLLFPYHKQTFS